MNNLALVVISVIGIATSPALPLAAAQAVNGAQEIVEEAQKRATTMSERYAGVLQSVSANGRTSEKRWIFERIGAHGESKTIIRFTDPPEVSGVALLIVNHPD